MVPRKAMTTPTPAAKPEPEDDEKRSIAGIIAEVQAAANEDTTGTWRVEVYAVYPQPRDGLREPHLFDCQISELPELRQTLHTYGSGRYRIRVRRDALIAKQFDIEIAESLQDRARATGRQEDGGLLLIMKGMIDEQRAFNERILARLEAAPPVATPAAANPVEQFSQFAAAMKAWNEMLPKPAPQPDAMDLFMKGISFAEKIAPREGGTSVVDALRDFATSESGKELMTGLAQLFRPVQQQPPRRGGQPQPLRVPQVAPQAPGLPPELAQALGYLHTQAAAGADPAIAARFILDTLPDEVLDQIASFVQVENAHAQLSAIYPDLAPFADWVNGFVEKIVELDSLEGEGNEDDASPSPAANELRPDPGRTGGDARSAQGNAQHRQNGEIKSGAS